MVASCCLMGKQTAEGDPYLYPGISKFLCSLSIPAHLDKSHHQTFLGEVKIVDGVIVEVSK